MFQTIDYVNSHTNYSPIAPLLDQTAARWIFSPTIDFGYDDIYDGCLVNSDGSYTLSGTARNLYGLSFQSVKYFGTNGAYDTASAGDTFYPAGNYWFHEAAQPALQTVGYYFARPGIDVVPGDPGFSVTNTPSSPIIVPVGQPVYLAAWAIQTVTNGYSNVRAISSDILTKPTFAIPTGTSPPIKPAFYPNTVSFFRLIPAR